MSLDTTSVASICELDGIFELYSPDSTRFLRDLLKIPGIEMILDPETGKQDKQGDLIGWRFYRPQWNHFICVLGIHYSGKLISVDGVSLPIHPRKRSDLNRLLNPVPPKAFSYGIRLQPAKDGGWIEILTPFHTGFKDELKRVIPAKARAWKETHWEVTLKYRETVEGLIQKHFEVRL